MAFLPYVAWRNGYYEAEGVRVAVVEYPSGKRAFHEGVFADKADISSTAATPVVFASLSRDDFVILATIASGGNDIVVVADGRKKIDTPDKLRGKVIGTQKASSIHFFLSLFLLSNGMEASDATIRFLKAEELVPALVAGEIDAFSMREPYIDEAKKALGDDAVIFSKPALFVKTFHLLASRRVATERREAMRGVIRALLKAEAFVQKHPNRSAAMLKEWLDLPEETPQRLIGEIDYRIGVEQGVVLSLSEIARWVIANDLGPAEATPPDFGAFYFTGPLRDVAADRVTILE